MGYLLLVLASTAAILCTFSAGVSWGFALKSGENVKKKTEIDDMPLEASIEKLWKLFRRSVDNFTFFKFIEKFHVVESSQSATTYEHHKDGMVFKVVYEHGQRIRFTVRHGETMLVDFDYLYKGNTLRNGFGLLKNQIHKDVLNSRPGNQQIEHIEHFVAKIKNSTKVWGKLKKSLITVVPDEETPESTDNANETTRHAPASESAPEPAHIRTLLDDNHHGLPSDLLSLFQTTVANIELCLKQAGKLEETSKHSVQSAMQHDLERLLHAYNQLNENSKEEMCEQVKQAVDFIRQKTNDINHLLEQDNKREVEQAVRTILVREYSQ